MKTCNKLFGMVFLLLAGSMLISACSNDTSSASNKFQVNLRADPGEGGDVSPPFGKYEAGSELEITASPSDGYRFENWSGGYTGSDKNTTITVDEAKSITANFVRKSYDLTVDTTGKGSVNEKVLKSKTTSYKGDTKVQLTAKPATGWMFDHWEGDLSGSDNPATIIIEGPRQVTAVFTPTEYELTIKAEDGAVKQEVVKSKSYQEGTKVRLTANPDQGFVFDHWEDDLSGMTNPETITMDGPKTVTAIFKGETFALNITTEGNGNESVSQEPDSAEYAAGTVVMLRATPGDGQQFSKWTGDVPAGMAANNPLPYTVDASNDITAVFATTREGKPNGDGTEASPYIITSYSNLKWVSENDNTWGAQFEQTLDINAVPSKDENGGKGFSPIGNYGTKFSGVYNGGGHKISNLTINRPNDANIGFIGVTNGGTLENLSLVDITVTANGVTGGAVGRNIDGEIHDIYVSGTVTATKAAGGIVGNNKPGNEIVRVYADVEVTAESGQGRFVGGVAGVNVGTIKQAFATGNVSGIKVVGGLVGNHKGTIENSYATGKVTGVENFVGGLVGANNGDAITASYAVGEVTSEADPDTYKPGGLSGGKYPQKITKSYWDVEASGVSISNGATGLTTSEMQGANAKSNMEGFDFDNVWQVNPNGYPTLRDNPPAAE